MQDEIVRRVFKQLEEPAQHLLQSPGAGHELFVILQGEIVIMLDRQELEFEGETGGIRGEDDKSAIVENHAPTVSNFLGQDVTDQATACGVIMCPA